MALLVAITYEIVTHESAEDGEAAERGHITEREAWTFRELVSWMRGGECSCSHVFATGHPRHCWITQDQGETRAFFEDGEREFRSVHFHADNPWRKARYWFKAMKAAGFEVRA